MNNIYWLLFLIPISVAASVALSEAYAAVKVRAFFDLEEIDNNLRKWREGLRDLNVIYYREYKLETAEPYITCGRSFEKTLKASHDKIFSSVKTRKDIFDSILRTTEKPFLKVVSAPLRIFFWFQAAKRISALRASVLNHERDVKSVRQMIDKLYNLPAETAQQIKSMHTLLTETILALNELLAEGVHGNEIQMLDADVKRTEDSLAHISDIFYTLPSSSLVVRPNIKKETQTAFRVLMPAKTSTIRLSKKVTEWKAALKQLKFLVATMQNRLDDADSKFAFLDKQLNWHSSIKEELSELRQETLASKDILKSPTLESLNPALNKSKNMLKLLENLLEVLKNYEKRISVLYKSMEQVAKDIASIDAKIQEAASRAEYPILWTNSQKDFEGLKRNFERVPPLSQKRSVEELQESISLVSDCDKLSKKLFQSISKVNADLAQSIELWSQIALVYKREYLPKIEELYSQAIVYDLSSNWDVSDNVKDFCNDAIRLWEMASSNVPTSKSIPIQEQSTSSLLTTAKELVRQKPLFDKRQNRIELRLKKIQKDEQEALSIYERNRPPLSQLARELQLVDEESPVTKKIVEYEELGLVHLQLLQQRKNGKVEEKLEKLLRWEKEAIENAQNVNQIIEHDLQSCKNELAERLKETKIFAEELEDEIVLQAKEVAIIFDKHQLVVDSVHKPTMLELQKHASSLLRQRQKIIGHDSLLEKFLKPIKDEYQQIYEMYNRIKSELDILKSADKLGRKWPPVFRGLRKIEDRLNAFIREMKNIRARCNKKDRLLIEYDALRRELKTIRDDVLQINEMDQRDVEFILSLQRKYLDLAADHARKICKGNVDGEQKMIQIAKEHIYDFLPRAYNYGVKREDGSVSPRWTASQIKENLEEEISEKRQQIINFNNVNARDINIDQALNY